MYFSNLYFAKWLFFVYVSMITLADRLVGLRMQGNVRDYRVRISLWFTSFESPPFVCEFIEINFKTLLCYNVFNSPADLKHAVFPIWPWLIEKKISCKDVQCVVIYSLWFYSLKHSECSLINLPNRALHCFSRVLKRHLVLKDLG